MVFKDMFTKMSGNCLLIITDVHLLNVKDDVPDNNGNENEKNARLFFACLFCFKVLSLSAVLCLVGRKRQNRREEKF